MNPAGLLYGMLLIAAANYELRAKDAAPLTALLSLGLSESPALWKLVERLIRRMNAFEEPSFDRHNPVHRAAGLLLLAYLAWSAWQLLSTQAGGSASFFAPDLGGVLKSLAAATLFYVALSALGAGWRIRRDWRGVLRRLGLSKPTVGDCGAGLVFGALIFLGMTLASSALHAAGPGDPSGARPLFDIVKVSLPAALLVAILAGTGEEILFRGALQPVFGLVVSSLLFTFVHVQYGLSPALLILFFVSLGLGLVRRRYNTTAAIIAHATYNFLPFLIHSLLPS